MSADPPSGPGDTPVDPAEVQPGPVSAAERARLQAYRTVVAVLCGPPEAEEGPELLRFSGSEAGFVGQQGGLHVLAVDGPGDPVVPWLEQLAEGTPLNTVHQVLVVHPEPPLRAALEALELRFPKGGRVDLFVLDEDGVLWSAGEAELGPELSQITPAALADPPSREAWAAALQAATARGEEFRAQAARWKAPRPVSIGLLVVVLLVWLLEELWGGSGFLPTLARMGAVVGEGETLHEPWRLGASTLLHGGSWHVAVNGFMLYGLGGLLERMLGGGRMVLTFTLAGLGGALAAALVGGHGVTVGASGGLFGLFAVLCWVTWFPGEVLSFKPERQRRLKSSLVRDMLLLGLISLVPGVSLAGHAGGALVGLGLAASGLITRPPVPETGPRSTTLVAACATVLLGSLGLALVQGQPWELSDLEATREVSHRGFVLRVPAALDPVQTEPASEEVAAFGAFFEDPVQILVQVDEDWAVAGEDALSFGELTATAWNEDAAVGAFERSEPAVAYEEGDEVLVTEAFARRDGLTLRRGALLSPRARVTVEVLAFTERPESRAVFIESLLLEGRWSDEAPPSPGD